MDRRGFCKWMAASATLGATGAFGADRLASESGFPKDSIHSSNSAKPQYPNSREPLLKTTYSRLPLGAVRPMGWLRNQLDVQVNGLSGHVGEMWDVLKVSAWKGDAGKNILPECCTPRFVPRWLEGVTVLAGVLGDDRVKKITDPYMQYILAIDKPASITPSVCAWSHLGRFLPDYFELTSDPRAIALTRKILDYADSVRDSKDKSVVEPGRLGMLLSFGYWYYNQTGDPDIPALLVRCTKSCVDDWKDYFVNFPANRKYFAHFPDKTAERPKVAPSEYTRQGVDVTQAIQYPIQYYLMSKDAVDKLSVVEGISNLDKGYGQVGGRWSGDEWLADTNPTQGTELCDIEELLFSLEKGIEITGDSSFADRIEQLIYNAFPGTCTADMWAHQYDQQANQVLVSVAGRHWHWNDDNSNIYGFKPNFPCCLSNMHSPWPRFVQSMWMASTDGGLVKLAYGPSRVSARVAAGATVEITEETGYPFSDRVRFTVLAQQPVSFPIYFRIPAWAQHAEMSISGQPLRRDLESGTFLKVERRWNPGDVVSLSFHFKVRCETRRNNAVSIAWGPLYFVLRIGESFQSLPGLTVGDSDKLIPAPPGAVDWQITATTPWNYALAIDRHEPRCDLATNKISSMPFAQRGEVVKPPGASNFAAWTQDVPMILRVKAHRIPEWGMAGANAAEDPASPVHTESPETVVELIPYGCSRLRIAEFPTTPTA